MSFPRSEADKTEEAIKKKANELNELCRAAYLNFANQLVTTDPSNVETVKACKKTQNEANDVIDAILREKILAIDSNIKKLSETRNNLRVIIDKKLSNILLSDSEESQLQLYSINQTELAIIAVEKKKLDAATSILFKIQPKVPEATNESAASRQALASHIVYDILTASSDKEKADAIDHWARMLKVMLDDGNYYGAFIIYNTLNNDHVKNSKAMSLTTDETANQLSNASGIFANNNTLQASMEASAKAGKTVIPSLHLDEGALVGCAAENQYIKWNEIVGRLNSYADKLRSDLAPSLLKSQFASSLIEGRISTNAKLTRTKEGSNTEVSIISILEKNRTTTLKSDEFNDLMAVSSRIKSKLEAMQEYIDERSNNMQDVIIKRKAILQQVMSRAKDVTGSFSTLANLENQKNVIDLIESSLAERSIANRKGFAKGETQTYLMLAELRDLFAQLNRKTKLVKITSQEFSAEMKPEQPKVESNSKPIYIGPKPTVTLSKMRNILNRSEVSAVQDNLGAINKALDVMLEQKKLRRHETLFDPLSQKTEAMVDYLQAQQDRLSVRQDHLRKEYEAAVIVQQAIIDLRNQHGQSKEISRLISGFNSQIGKMALDAINHPDDLLLAEINKLKFSKIVSPKKSINDDDVSLERSDSERLSATSQIQMLDQKRSMIVTQSHARYISQAKHEKGKEEMPPLSDVEQKQADDLGAEIARLQQAESEAAEKTRFINAMNKTSLEPTLVEEPNVTLEGNRKSTIMRILERVGALFARAKDTPEKTASQSMMNDSSSIKSIAKAIDPQHGGKSALAQTQIKSQSVAQSDTARATAETAQNAATMQNDASAEEKNDESRKLKK